MVSSALAWQRFVVVNLVDFVLFVGLALGFTNFL
jgi:hypothetical protein